MSRITQKPISTREHGAAAVEFAVILPLFLFIIFSVIEFSIVLYNKAVITNASREAARAGIITNPKKTEIQIKQVAEDRLNNQLIPFSPESYVVTILGANQSFGSPLTVTINYTYNGLGLGSLLSALNGPLNVTATTVMAHE